MLQVSAKSLSSITRLCAELGAANYVHVGAIDVSRVPDHVGEGNADAALDQRAWKTVSYPGEKDL